MDFSTPDLCDQFAEHVRVLNGVVWRSFGGREKFHGPVETVKCFEDNSRVKEALSEAGQGRVLVVDGGGSLRHALIGDQIAGGAVENGWAGVVIYGACRDVEILSALDIGLLALSPVPIKSVRRDEGQRGIPITIADALIEPGDYLYADANGVVVASTALL